MSHLTGVHYPSLASLCSQRIEEGERGFLMSVMHSGSNLGYIVHTHAHTYTHTHMRSTFSDVFVLLSQHFDSWWAGVPDVGVVRLGERLLRQWAPVWTLGAHGMAMFPERYLHLSQLCNMHDFNLSFRCPNLFGQSMHGVKWVKA